MLASRAAGGAWRQAYRAPQALLPELGWLSPPSPPSLPHRRSPALTGNFMPS
jgi:hypothetical protein